MELLSACVLSLRVLMCLWNYLAFSKILKKHDKLSSCPCRAPYLLRIQRETFAATAVPELIKGISDVHASLEQAVCTAPTHDEQRACLVIPMGRRVCSSLSRAPLWPGVLSAVTRAWMRSTARRPSSTLRSEAAPASHAPLASFG